MQVTRRRSISRRARLPALLLAGQLVLPAILPGQAAVIPQRHSPTPKLLVFLTIDAMRPDYFERFRPQLTGGLGMLYNGGAVFTNGYQDHAITETAPGHASTMSGRFPVHTGIAANTAGVGDSSVLLIDAGGLGASPFRFRGTTLTDWLLAKDKRTRVLSISRKDRGAILPVGRSKQQVFWYMPNGIFTTSTYYADTLPTWVQLFNAMRIPASYAGRTWELQLPATAYPEPDSVPIENGGVMYTFPHYLPGDSVGAAAWLGGFPWMDDVTLQLALAGVHALNLGAGPQTDILAISLSTTDAVGHQYGPDSREMHDQIVHLDRALGAFFDSLFATRKRSDVIIALTADHGLTPYPEVHAHDPNGAARRVNVWPLVDKFRADLKARGVKNEGIWFENGVVTIDRVRMREARVNPDSVVRAFQKAVVKVPGVLRADRISELKMQDTTRDAIARRWLHMFDNESHAALVVTAEPYDYWVVSGSAQHGVPHESDTHVPMIFYGKAFKSGRYAAFARVVDMAPTLAAVLRVKPMEKLDGHVLTKALH